MVRRSRRLSAVLALAGLQIATLHAAAQTHDANAPPPPTWAGDLAFLSGNAVLGGLTAGLIRELRGGEFWPAFRTGVAGGAIAYAGRRIAVEQFAGAGFLGREVAAAGTSVARNAAEGRSTLHEIVFPLWLIRLYLRTDTAAGLHARVKADLPTLLATAYLGLRGDARFDISASLSSGMPVFRTHVLLADGYWKGNQSAGVIWLHGNPEDPNPDAQRSAVIAHERVHVLQYDFGLLLWSDPAEAWLAERIPGGPRVHDYLDLGLHLLPWGLANWALPYRQRPWEHEAHFLSGISAERE